MKNLLKRTLGVIFALLPCLSISVIASSDGPDEIPLRPIYEENTRPRSIGPECYYLDGYIYIVGDASVTSISATVTRQSDNAQWNGVSNSNTLQIAVPNTAGYYHIILTLSDGSSYYGDYTL